MGFKEPKMLTPEEMAKIQKERILVEAELIRGGADVEPDGRIDSTEEQKKDAKIEMGEYFYKKSKELEEEIAQQKDSLNQTREKLQTVVVKMRVEKEVNGTRYVIKWHPDYEEYIISFPDLELDTKNGIYETGFSISTNKEDVIKVKQIVEEVATNETDLGKVYKESFKRFQSEV